MQRTRSCRSSAGQRLPGKSRIIIFIVLALLTLAAIVYRFIPGNFRRETMLGMMKAIDTYDAAAYRQAIPFKP